MVMADPGIQAIDRFFDKIEEVADKVDHVFNRAKSAEEKVDRVIQEHRPKKVIDVEAVPSKPASTSTAVKAKAPSRARRFRIVESIVPASGQTIFVVTDGANARAECSTREMAEKLLHALEAK